jgi:outer membrane protein
MVKQKVSLGFERSFGVLTGILLVWLALAPMALAHKPADFKPVTCQPVMLAQLAPVQPVPLQGSIQNKPYTVDLPTVLMLVEKQNLPLAQSKATVKINQGVFYQRLTALLPDVSASYNQSRLEGGTQIFGGETFQVIRKTVQPQLAISWTVYPGGRTVFDALAARQRKANAVENVKLTLQQQLARASEEYYQLLAAETRYKVAEMAIKQAMVQADAARARYKAGTGTRYDWLRTQTLVAEQQRLQADAISQVTLTQQALLNRLNLDADIALVTPLTAAKADISVLPATHTLVPESWTKSQLLSEGLNNNPQLSAIDKDLAALGWDRKAIWSDVVPSVTVRAYVGGTGPTADQLVRTEFRGVTANANLLTGMGLNIPARLVTNRAELERRQLERQAQLRNVETQVITAWQNSQTFLAAITVARQEVALAQESLTLITGRFRAGYATTIEVVDAQTAVANARNKQVQAQYQYQQAQIRLVEAMGLATTETLVKGVNNGTT